MNILWAVVIIPYLGATPQFVEVWQTKEPCVKYAREIQGGNCFPVSVGNKYQIEEQVKSINELLK